MTEQAFTSWTEVALAMRTAIEAALPGAQVLVEPRDPGHFAIQVVSGEFAGKTMVKQQQLVYGAITPLMRGENAPVHAIDEMVTKTP